MNEPFLPASALIALAMLASSAMGAVAGMAVAPPAHAAKVGHLSGLCESLMELRIDQLEHAAWDGATLQPGNRTVPKDNLSVADNLQRAEAARKLYELEAC